MKGPEKLCLHLIGKLRIPILPSINSCPGVFDAVLVAQGVLYWRYHSAVREQK